MHLHVIICFALVIWWPSDRPFDPAISSPIWTWLAVWAQVPILLLVALATSGAALRRLSDDKRGPQQAQHYYHRTVTVLRLLAVAGFAGSLLGTDWPGVVRSLGQAARVPGLGDMLMLTPFFAAVVVIFAGTYRIDRALHQVILESRDWPAPEKTAVWTLSEYLNFNLRHHLLVVVVPMVLILAAFDLARSQGDLLNRTFRIAWAADVVPGIAAAAVFVIAPLLLRYVWPTRPLPEGPLRRRLEGICGRIGLRYRDILIWQSGSMMINAAVMGLFGPVRYIMLSDGLLETLSREQIEAVFGHEAGHVRHRHIQFFLLFAVCSMLMLSAVVEALRLSVENGLVDLSVLNIQLFGGVCVVAFWGIGFGWISRRFERQADLFGAQCVAPDDAGGCDLPCNVHGCATDGPASPVCATGATVFVSALDRVAVLNGIPREERSWRHSSIASRMRFLTSLTGDPTRARRFERVVRRIKVTLLVVAAAGSAIAGVYVWDHPIYGIRVEARSAEGPEAARTNRYGPSGSAVDAGTNH